MFAGDAADFPDGTAATSTNLIDAIVYDTNDSDDAGLLAVLTPGQPQVNEGGGDGSTVDSNQRCPDGWWCPNTEDYTQAAPTPGATNDCASVSDHRQDPRSPGQRTRDPSGRSDRRHRGNRGR